MNTNKALLDKLDDKQFSERFASNVRQMETLFWEIGDHSGMEIETPIKRREHPDAVHGGMNEVFRISSSRPGESTSQEEKSMAETAVPA